MRMVNIRTISQKAVHRFSWVETVKRFLPLLRLLAKIFRPFAVAILSLENPCLFLLLRFGVIVLSLKS